MTHVLGELCLVVNPQAGNGGAARTLARLRAALDEHGLDHVVVSTTRPGDATEAARSALRRGCRYLVAVGGDGTVHEVVNGMFTPEGEPLDPKAVLGVVAAGSGCDFIRTFGLDHAPELLARHLASETIMPVDVGRVRYTDFDGRPAERLFVNIAEVGYGGEVVRLADRLPRFLGRLRYLLAAWGAIRRIQRPETAITLAHTEVTRPLVELVVANAQFFGGGMKVAPRALPDDGRFNVQVFFGQRSQVFVLTQRMFRGEHLPHPQISEFQSDTVGVEPPVPLLVEADGELLGTTPARFSLLPRALRLKV